VHPWQIADYTAVELLVMVERCEQLERRTLG
jgi:hypothetical protein